MDSLWLGPANDYARGWLTTGQPDPDPEVVGVLADGAWNSLRPYVGQDR